MRKIAILLILLLLATPAAPGEALELDVPGAPTATAQPLPASPLSPAPLLESPPMRLDCAAALLMEADSGQIIFQMNADTPRPVASITKVMTILLTLEQLQSGRVQRQEEVTVSQRAAGMGGSQVLLDVGERQSLGTLLRCMIVGSANDAAVALAETLYGSEELCVDAMNERARQLGMADTHFVNCTGLPAQDQRTTARDVAAMSRQLFAQEGYYEDAGVWMEDIVHGDGRVTQLVNTNKLLKLYDGCDGGKTGSTKEAGYCVSATARRGDMRLIAVVLGAQSGKERFAIASQMLDYGFANYRRYPVARRGTRVRGQLAVTGGDASGVDMVLDEDLTLLIPKGDEQKLSLVPELPEAVPAPVAEGQALGYVAVEIDGRQVARLPIVAAGAVEAKGVLHTLRRLLNQWVGRY